MYFLILSVICSVLVSVLFKLAPRHRIDIAQAVTWNYLLASVLTLTLLQPSLASLDSEHAPWLPLLTLALVLPGIFLVMARAVRQAGIVRSDVAQRMSLLLSLLAAFLVFGETANGWKFAGLGLGLLAVLGISLRPRADAAGHDGGRTWPWLLGVWVGYALVDILLKKVALSGTPSIAALFASFSLAFVLMLALQLWRHLRGHSRLRWHNFGAGAVLGLLNFGNILFYVRAHQHLPDSPAVVFAGMNIGVVVTGALVGIFAFGERTSLHNRIGLGLAVVAIALIAFGTGS